MDLSYYFRIDESPTGSAKVSTVGYAYKLLSPGADRDGAQFEILTYHFHPLVTPNVAFPHLHIGWDASFATRPISRAHIPTGMMPLPSFLRLLVRDFDVHARPPYDEYEVATGQRRYEAILEDTESRLLEALA